MVLHDHFSIYMICLLLFIYVQKTHWPVVRETISAPVGTVSLDCLQVPYLCTVW